MDSQCQKKMADAILMYNSPLKINLEIGKTYQNKEITFKELKKFNESIIGINPNNHQICINKGDNYNFLLEIAKMQQQCITNIKPDNAFANCNKGADLYYLNRNCLENIWQLTIKNMKKFNKFQINYTNYHTEEKLYNGYIYMPYILTYILSCS
ncbi:hypothetical protein pb186bvf_014700 [Paramecium bursaria]